MFMAQRQQLGMHIAPLAHAQPGEKILPAPLALLVRCFMFPDHIRRLPEFEIGKKLGLFIFPLRMRLIG